MPSPEPVRLLLLDHYDSFVHNLARYLRRGGRTDTVVVRADQTTVGEIQDGNFDGILISPGPKRPEDVGIGVALVRELSADIPILGVCLGHQAIATALGGDVVRCPPVHGMSSRITHDGVGVFENCRSPMSVARYHALAVDESTLPPELCVTARTEDGIVMGIRHLTRPVQGVQFHPESVLTDHGGRIIDNFVAGVRRHRDRYCYPASHEAVG